MRTETLTHAQSQGPNKDFALHTIGWQAFQDLAVSIAEVEYDRPVSRVAKVRDHGRDGWFYGLPESKVKKNDQRETTIQCKHFSGRNTKLTPASLSSELTSVRKVVSSNRAHGYILITNANVTEGDRLEISKALRGCGVNRPYIFGRDWVIAKILEHPRVRALVPRVYGLGDLGWIIDDRARQQAEAILDTMGDDLRCYVPTLSHRKAVEALARHRIVLLLGDPAVGKSTIAAALSLAATDEDESEAIYVRNPEEFVSGWDPNIENRLFWIDDAFGSIQYAPELMDRWNKVLLIFKAAVRRKNRFIITSRTYIWRQAESALKRSAFPPLKDGRVVVDVEQLSDLEKRRILYNHLKFGGQPRTFLKKLVPHLEGLVASQDFRPEIARRLGSPAFTTKLLPTADELSNFFGNPEEFLRDTLSNLDANLRAAVGLIFVNAGRLTTPIRADATTSLVCELFGVTTANIRAALVSMKGGFAVLVDETDDSYWTYKHPTIGDAYASLIGSNNELITLYVRGTKLPQILREAVCGPISVDGAAVRVPPSLHSLLIDRFAGAKLSKENIWRFLTKRCNGSFVSKFVNRYPEIVDKGIYFGRPVAFDSSALFLIKVAEAGVLSATRRERFLDLLAEQVTREGDFGFLDNDPDFESFLTEKEVTQLRVLAHDKAMDGLDELVDSEASEIEDTNDPETWFEELLSSFSSLASIFPGDEGVERARSIAESRIIFQIEEIQESRGFEEEPDWNPREQKSGAQSDSSCSIFDDLV